MNKKIFDMNIINHNCLVVNVKLSIDKSVADHIVEKNNNAFNDKKRRWEQKKNSNITIAERMYQSGFEARGIRMMQCATFLEIQKCLKCGKRKVVRANLCRDKFCPICSWRLSSQRALEMAKMLRILCKREKGVKLQFLTLTQKNVNFSQIEGEIEKINKGWHKLIDRNKRNQNKLLGYARSLEITYNAEKDELHPHLHIILAWSEGTKPFTQKRWREEWCQAMELDYEPICKLSKIDYKDSEDKEKTKEIIKSALEAFKYSIKSKELETMPSEVFKTLVDSLSGKRVVNYGGEFKKIRQEMGLKQDTEIPEEIEINEDTCSCGNEVINSVLKWSFGDKEYQEIEGISCPHNNPE